MLKKPPACDGCPLRGDGWGFVPDETRPKRVTILAQNPGDHEEEGKRVIDYGQRFGSRQMYITAPYARGPAPLLGPTGFLLEREFLPRTGLTRDDISLCNVLKCRQQLPGKRIVRTNDMPEGKVLAAAIEHCTAAYLRIPETTELVIAMGAHAWRQQGGPGTVTDWRGFLKP